MSFFTGDPIADVQILKNVSSWTQWNAMKNTNSETLRILKAIENDIFRRCVRICKPQLGNCVPCHQAIYVQDPDVTKEMIILHLINRFDKFNTYYREHHEDITLEYYKPSAIVDPVSMVPLKRQRLYLMKLQGTVTYLLKEPTNTSWDGDFQAFVQMITAEQIGMARQSNGEGGVKRTRIDADE